MFGNKDRAREEDLLCGLVLSVECDQHPLRLGRARGAPGHVAYEERWRPVVRWNRGAGDVRWRFEAVAFPARSPGDSVLAILAPGKEDELRKALIRT